MQRLTTKLTVWIGLFLLLSPAISCGTAPDASPDKGDNGASKQSEAKTKHMEPAQEETSPKKETIQKRAAPPKRILYIGRRRKHHSKTGAYWIKWSLPYEICRQAILISGRDELGCLTRDYWLHETPPKSDDALCIEIKTHERPAPHKMAYELIPAGESFKKEGEIKADWPLFAGNPNLLALSLATAAEEASRTTCPEALRKLGLDGEPNKWNADAPVPDDVADLLEEATFTSQFLAIRQLHAAIREDGESRARLYALVRAYAQLGMLTEHAPHPFGDVCKARAIVYAQRAFVKSKGAPQAMAVRAATHAFAGYHAIALKEFASLKEKHPDFTLAGWPRLAGLFCHYELDTLKSLGEDEDSGAWADLLTLLTLHYSGRDREFSEFAQAASQRRPECYRMYGELIRYGDFQGKMRGASGIDVMGERLYPRLAAIESLPSQARRIVDERAKGAAKKIPWQVGGGDGVDSECAARRELIDLLREPDGVGSPAEDPHELSWQALGGLLWELSYAQAAARAESYVRPLCAPADKWVETCAPLVRGHRFETLFKTFASGEDGIAAVKRLSTKDDTERIGFVHKYVRRGLWLHYRHAPYVYSHILDSAKLREDHGNLVDVVAHVYNDRKYRDATRPPQGANARRLNAVSPVSPLAAMMLLQTDWKNQKEKADELVKRHADHPELCECVARCWLNDPDCRAKGIALLKKLNEDDPTSLLSKLIGTALLNDGDDDGAMEVYLHLYKNGEHRGLEKNSAASRISRIYRRRGEMDSAVEWAERAADCYSSWGLEDLAHCKELAGDFEEAVEIEKRRSDRYENHAVYWYLACRRTGVGDVDAARAKAMREYDHYKDRIAWRNKGSDLESRSMVAAWAEGKLTNQAVFDFMHGRFKEQYNSFYGTQAFLLAVEMQDDQKRDAILASLLDPKPIKEKKPIVQPSVFKLTQLIHEDMKDGKPGDVDDDEVIALAKSSQNLFHAIHVHYFYGKYLALAGKTDRAVASWKRAAAVPEVRCSTREQAILELWKNGFSTDAYRKLLKEAFRDGSPRTDEG